MASEVVAQCFLCKLRVLVHSVSSFASHEDDDDDDERRKTTATTTDDRSGRNLW